MLFFKQIFDVSQLKTFPGVYWGEVISSRWEDLCNQLQDYVPTVPHSLITVHPQRKWELVSAYQKSVRRGLKERSMWLATGFLSESFDPKEKAYFWRRICTTACEDVGYGDPELMNFVIACSMLFKPSSPASVLRRVWLFLTEKMCEAQKSRIYCQLSIIENQIRTKEIPDENYSLSEWEKKVIEVLSNPLEATDERGKWALKNNWRGEGMLKFQAFPIEFNTVIFENSESIKYKVLHGLPDYCYDKHTRVGKIVCASLAKHQLSEHLNSAMPNGPKTEAVGWALFFAEGGLIRNPVICNDLSVIEINFVAKKFNMGAFNWIDLTNLIHKMVLDGTVNELRERFLKEQGY